MKRWYILLSILTGLVLAGGLLLLPGVARADGGTFTVDAPGDGSDASPGDCVCDAGCGLCTLRAAIEEANACPGAQVIRFQNAGTYTITAALPPLSDDGTSIDASDQWVAEGGYYVPGVVIQGNGGAFSGFEITASDCSIYGLQIVGFGQHGVYVHGDARNNTIGNRGFFRNVISRNGWDGVLVNGSNATDNTVQFNYVGLNPIGEAGTWQGISDWGNGHHGISVWYGSNNFISNNGVGSNGWSGITMDALDGITVLGNTIGEGMDNGAAGNRSYGVHIGNGASNASIRSNYIAHNQRGVLVTGGSHDVTLESNIIYSNTATALSTPYGGGVLVESSGSSATIQMNQIESNTAQYGGGIGFINGGVGVIQDNTIQNNRAVPAMPVVAVPLPAAPQGGGPIALGGGIYLEDTEAWILENDILTNTIAEDTNAYTYGGGISVNDSEALIAGNEIRGNRLDNANTGFGGAVSVIGNNNVILEANHIDENSISSGYGGAMYINTGTATGSVTVQNNRFFRSHGGNSAVDVSFSQGVSLENNLIFQNYKSGLSIRNNHDVITATNNTIANNLEHGIVVDHSPFRLVNTIVAYNSEYGIYQSSATIANSHNDFWSNSSGVSNGSFSTMTADPLFMDYEHRLYGLRAGSPCRDSGDPAEYASWSYNGLPRPQGSGPDIGAYEMPLPTYLPIIMR